MTWTVLVKVMAGDAVAVPEDWACCGVVVAGVWACMGVPRGSDCASSGLAVGDRLGFERRVLGRIGRAERVDRRVDRADAGQWGGRVDAPGLTGTERRIGCVGLIGGRPRVAHVGAQPGKLDPACWG